MIINRHIRVVRTFWEMAHRSAIILLLLANIFNGSSLHADTPAEPPVTRAEADLLDNVLALAEEDENAAAELLRRQITDTSSAALHLVLGNLYFGMEEWDRAEQSYLAAIRKLPEYRQAVTNLAQLYLLRDDTVRAAEILAGYLERGNEAAPEIYLLLGQAYAMGEDWVPAESAFRQALMFRPRSREGRSGLARVLLAQERFGEAASLIMALIEENPAQTEWWSLRANLHLAQDRIDAAITTLESARRLDAITPGMLAMLGDLYLGRGQIDESLRAYELSFAAAEPSRERMLRVAEGFLYHGENEQAALWIGRAADAMSEEPATAPPVLRLLRLQAELARQKGDMEEAHALYNELLEREPLNGRTLLALADIERIRERPDEAVMLCQRAARIDGYQARALTMLARIEVNRGRYQQAIRALERAVEYDDRREIRDYLDHVRRLSVLQ